MAGDFAGVIGGPPTEGEYGLGVGAGEKEETCRRMAKS